MLDPDSRPSLHVTPLLRLLHERGVDWVLSGSAVLTLYGADLRPNDLDVVPSLDPANLRRIAGLLVELDAVPAREPSWHKALTRRECLDWRPDPPTAEQLDHLFVTRLGMVDVTPKLTGSYAELRPGATSVELAGVPVWVCSPDEVLGRLPAKPRPKDVERAAQYAIVREAVRRGEQPRGARWLDS
ncbi:nucleotidyltransferase family protein [Lentzea atacamensis]|uniref:nucleotidyltransferase family protein n=1 Tax=Lentzea atacamensis TaxID=531938 RepID=UPI0011BE6CDB|nr:nucleotidyltransferase family protein [Lentzea atacamensis]